MLALELSNTLDSEFWVLAADGAPKAHSAPETFNTDLGSQFTAHVFTGCLE